jgi:reactive chlorine resistance protein C
VFESAAQLARMGISVTRIGLVMVPVWIGGLKAFRYEVEGIMPFMANSPFMGFFYRQPAGESCSAASAASRRSSSRG